MNVQLNSGLCLPVVSYRSLSCPSCEVLRDFSPRRCCRGNKVTSPFPLCEGNRALWASWLKASSPVFKPLLWLSPGINGPSLLCRAVKKELWFLPYKPSPAPLCCREVSLTIPMSPSKTTTSPGGDDPFGRSDLCFSLNVGWGAPVFTVWAGLTWQATHGAVIILTTSCPVPHSFPKLKKLLWMSWTRWIEALGLQL